MDRFRYLIKSRITSAIGGAVVATVLARLLGYLSPAETSTLLIAPFGVWSIFTVAVGLRFAPRAAPQRDVVGASEGAATIAPSSNE